MTGGRKEEGKASSTAVEADDDGEGGGDGRCAEGGETAMDGLERLRFGDGDSTSSAAWETLRERARRVATILDVESLIDEVDFWRWAMGWAQEQQLSGV